MLFNSIKEKKTASQLLLLREVIPGTMRLSLLWFLFLEFLMSSTQGH